MIRKGKIVGVIEEREYTSKDGGKYIAQSLLVQLPFTTINGNASYDEIIAERSVANADRTKVDDLLGKEFEFTLLFSTRQWENPTSGTKRTFQVCRLTKISEPIN